MSYILDALNKSDQEKQRRRATPGLDAHHANGDQTRPMWPWAIGFAVLVGMNGAALYWWLVPETVPPAAQTSALIPAPASAPATAAVPQPEVPLVVSSTQAQSPEEETPLLITPSDYAASTSAPAVDSPVSITSLPESVQKDLPELVFSSHIFASDADLRMVNINGRILREGETVTTGVMLLEITEEGVVLEFRDNQFEVSVLRDWFPPG